MRSRFSSSSFHAPEWWPEGETWPPRGGDGRDAWSGFGRTMVRRVATFFAVVLLVPIVFGALVGLAIGGGSGGLMTVPEVLLIVVATSLVLVLIGWLFFRSWRPVQQLIRAAGRLADGDYAVRVEPAGSASMRSVTASFNDMAGELESAREQRRRLLADVGHELRTPLTVLRGELEAMVDGVHRPDVEHIRLLLDDVEVMERLLEDLETLSQAEAGALTLHREPTDIDLLVEDVASSFGRDAAASGVTIVASAGAATTLDIDPVRIREVLANLVVNALRAMPDGGRLRLSATRERHMIVIRVADTGVGIPNDARDRVFDRFHKGSGSAGSGLGLTISRDLVEAHGGGVAIESTSSDGTTVSVSLPTAPGV